MALAVIVVAVILAGAGTWYFSAGRHHQSPLDQEP